jgi:adenine phosphoribosyltransferase
MTPEELRARLLGSFRWYSEHESRGLADRTGWLRDPELLGELGGALAGLFDESPTVVVGPHASGYPLGVLVAVHHGVGFVGVEKERRELGDSDRWITATTPPDYRDRTMTMGFRRSLVSSTDRVLVVDDWADTGGQLSAVRSLVEQAGAHYIGAAVIADALRSHATRRALSLRGLVDLRRLRSEG